MSDAAYLHGVDPVEQERLSRLNDWLNASSLRELAPRPGERIVDFGSGLGQVTQAIARQVGPAGRVVGIERSAVQRLRAIELAAAGGAPEAVDFRAGDVASPPLGDVEWGSFDVAHARFVLEHVADPLAVVRQMVRAVRPGGRIVLEDDDHDLLRLWPESPGFSTLWDVYVRAIHVNRNDPFVGRRLPALLHQAGAEARRSTFLFFGGCAGSAELTLMVESVIGIFDGARDRLLEASRIERRDYDAAIDAFRLWSRRPDAAL